MNTDNIREIAIDDLGRLTIRPEIEQFPMIWRSAAEVHWDKDGFLYSPMPREWSYLDWYRHILDIVRDEYSCKLTITEDTKWRAIPEELRSDILYKTNA